MAKTLSSMTRKEALEVAAQVIAQLVKEASSTTKGSTKRGVQKNGKHKQATRRESNDEVAVAVHKCRVCLKSGSDLVQFGQKHWGHPACIVRQYGAKAFERMNPEALKRIPRDVAATYKVSGALSDALSKVEPSHAAKSAE